MNNGEFFVSGYPESWDSLNVRDYIVQYGSVLRIRADQRGFSFITFDLKHSYDNLSAKIRSGNRKITVKPPDRTEDYKFDSIPAHSTIRELQVGFIRWQEDTPFFVEIERFVNPSFIVAHKQTLEVHFWKSNKRYKLCSRFKTIARIGCTETETEHNIFIQLNQPPEIYRLEAQRKFFPIWTIGNNEPGWKRVTSVFEDLSDFLSFEIKKLSMCIRLLKVHENDLIDCLRGIQTFEGIPDPISLPPPLTFQDVDTAPLAYQVKFMLYSLISLTIISIYDLSASFLSELSGLDPAKAANSMQHIITSHRSLALRTVPEFRDLFLDYYNDSSIFEPALMEEYETINRVLVTPSTSYFLIGEPELSNRVTRHFIQYKEDFLRITFTDENLNKILPYPEELLQRVEELLRLFPVAGKKFEVLAYSASQLKQHSVWMFSKDAAVTTGEIISWLGDFTAIKVPGKYVARVGLSFSASRRILELKPEEIEYTDDIFCNGFNFSDGAGTISEEIAAEINAVAKTSSCAFQFRMGGAKGVVCVDKRLEGRVISLRQSLLKYHSEHRVFELLNPSEFRYGFLNRQLIMLMNTLGTPDEVFLALQKEMLQSIDDDCKSFFCCMKAMNASNLAMQCLEKLMGRRQEPLAVEIKTLLMKRALNQLRKKQKIFLKKSGCLIGVIDELGVLDYGEIFVQVPEGVIEGGVVVAKNPCLHPGDIRVLKAVFKSELLHLRNVVVFPNKGFRPHTNECSGSDLDGDLYFVTWETRLIPPAVQDPMIYDSTPPIQEPGTYGTDTLISFFRKFVTNDRLGQIDNCHMALADSSPLYANDPRCIQLSELHGIAVDFAKTGNVVIVPREYTNIPFPDFMENTNQPSYPSSKILGTLYRDVKELPETVIPELLQCNLVEGYENFKEKATELVTEYKKDLKILMNRFGVAHEVELVIAQPLELSNYFQKKKREDEIRELLNYMSNKLIEKHRAKFEVHASKELASACYYVSHKELEVRAYPWVIAYEYLAND